MIKTANQIAAEERYIETGEYTGGLLPYPGDLPGGTPFERWQDIENMYARMNPPRNSCLCKKKEPVHKPVLCAPKVKPADDPKLVQQAKGIMQRAWNEVRANAAKWDPYKGPYLAQCDKRLSFTLSEAAYRITQNRIVQAIKDGKNDEQLLKFAISFLFDWSPKEYSR